jgi:F-type H+-transporting ATPase subunit delta
MSSLTTLARPYAKAAFDLARDADDLAGWDEMLKLASAMISEEAVARLLDSPHVSGADAVSTIVDAAGEAFDGRFSGFLGVLAGNDRLSLLPQISTLFGRLREEAEKRLRVRVISAVPLEEEQSRRLREALARRFELEIELDNEIDSSVIGGAVVYAGDEVIDGSLRGRLDRLSNRLAQ